MIGERTALKEWAVLVDAMARGDIVAMVRKGGIRERRGGFAVRHERFLFYPTFFHEKSQDLASRFVHALADVHERRPPEGMIRVEYVADVVGLWNVGDLDRLRAVDAEHGLAWTAVESRFHYRDRPGVHVVAARVAQLPRPIVLPEVRRYQGCVSWVELDMDIDVEGAVPVITADALAARVRLLCDALGPMERAGAASRQASDG